MLCCLCVVTLDLKQTNSGMFQYRASIRESNRSFWFILIVLKANALEIFCDFFCNFCVVMNFYFYSDSWGCLIRHFDWICASAVCVMFVCTCLVAQEVLGCVHCVWVFTCEVKSCCWSWRPSRRSQQRTVLSSPPVHSLVPSLEMSMQLAPSVWPWNCLQGGDAQNNYTDSASCGFLCFFFLLEVSDQI